MDLNLQFLKEEKKTVFGFPGPRPPALISEPPPPPPPPSQKKKKKNSTSSNSSYFKSSHYDHGLWVYGLFKPCWLTHPKCLCFKETTLLLNAHLSFFWWILSCAQVTNTYSELTNSFLVTLVALSTA